MCVLYQSLDDNGKNDLTIDYAIETLAYDIPHSQILLHVSFFLKNNSAQKQSLRIVHRGDVSDNVRPSDWKRHEDFEVLDLMRRVYFDRLSYNNDKTRFNFYSKPRRFAEKSDYLEDIVYKKKLLIENETKEISSSVADTDECRPPYTSLVIRDILSSDKPVFYSLSMDVKGALFSVALCGAASNVMAFNNGDVLGFEAGVASCVVAGVYPNCVYGMSDVVSGSY